MCALNGLAATRIGETLYSPGSESSWGIDMDGRLEKNRPYQPIGAEEREPMIRGRRHLLKQAETFPLTISYTLSLHTYQTAYGDIETRCFCVYILTFPQKINVHHYTYILKASMG
jgi:hypothetical protein